MNELRFEWKLGFKNGLKYDFDTILNFSVIFSNVIFFDYILKCIFVKKSLIRSQIGTK
jgi:hypothetical protein